MASHLEMKRIAENSSEVKALAQFLLVQLGDEGSPWETEFLDHMVARTAHDPLSMRQREKLLEIRDEFTQVSAIQGLSVMSLAKECRLGILDLDEHDAEWIAGLKISLTRTVKLREARRLRRCWQQLNPDA